MNQEALYLRLPVWLQNLACSYEGWRIQRARYNADFWRRLAESEERLGWPAAQLANFRDERLRGFLRHCYETVPYYRRTWDSLGLNYQKVQTLADLAAWPILDKTTVRANYAELLSTAVPEKDRVIAHTSGTTGAGLRFAVTREFQREQWAVWWRYRRWHGIQTDTWCGYFGGRSLVPLGQRQPPFWRMNHPGRQIMFSGYHVSPTNLPAYVAQLNRLRPPWLHGYPSLLAVVAGYLLDQGEKLDYQPQWITTGAENLLANQTALIEAAFGVRPRQHYGMSEGVANISETVTGKLVVDEDFAAVEFVPAIRGASPGDTGTQHQGHRIIGTNLANLALPLVRYEVGDIAQLPPVVNDEKNTTGGELAGRRVAEIDGRLEDYIVLKNGAKLGRMDHIFKDLVRIQEAQLYQNEPGKICIRIVRGQGYTPADEAQLLGEFRQRVGDQAELQVEYHPALARTPTGKLRFVVSQIPEGRI
ncbi:MAG: hypothetical protein SFX18_07530 [Pirellulales bacterium]|nr:hypothetical protein [Pirellulales bacterium]